MNEFLGTGWAFPPAFVKGYGVQMASGEEDIRQSLEILFSTSPGERIFNFEYGANIRRWIFEKMDLSVKTLIIEEIKHAILYFEPRIVMEKIDVEIKDPLEGILWISLEYSIRQTNSRYNMVYPFYFKEGTNI
ncbi:MAG: GPW/gp25 family protein [Dysgonamonadaceae bacterium]|jgi:phage baseplate assembly protein W|nr:GPW/gp25 family protein [Dysgonamonadaceae bacterium]